MFSNSEAQRKEQQIWVCENIENSLITVKLKLNNNYLFRTEGDTYMERIAVMQRLPAASVAIERQKTLNILTGVAFA